LKSTQIARRNNARRATFFNSCLRIEVSCFQVHWSVFARISRVVYILAMAVKRVLPIYP
jgi:hypothetical protein